jgi:hypothetical protein
MEKEVGRSGADAPSGSRPTDGAASVSTAVAASIPNAERDRKQRWYRQRRAGTADQREHLRLLKSAAPAAAGLPDDLRAAFLSIGPVGDYDEWASEPLVACSKRGLVARLEECGAERRALLTAWGEAVREVLLASATEGESPVGAAETPNPHDQNTREASDE